jgi:formylglycine-generating enzyme required for sulfatase activity
MLACFRGNFISVVVILILFIISGCASSETTVLTSQPTETQFQASFTAVEPSVKVFRGGSAETEVPNDQVVNIQVDDRIEAGQEGRGLLKFPNLLEIELFRNAKIRLVDAKQESGGSTFVRLNQLQGHVDVKLVEQSPVRVTLETEYATINTLEDGTEFLVCQAPGKLTCLKVLEGAVEITAQGKKQIIKFGEATYVLAGQPPKPAICAPDELFIAWKENMRNSSDTPAISQIVASLPDQPCSAETSENANLPTSEGMVKITYGTYQVGRNPANEYYSALHDIPLDNFWIDVHEVTNAQYQQYLDMTSDQPPAIWPGDENHPVRGVTWDQAVAYCSWAKKRLPSEAEWEIAGRGPGANAPIYPWGNDPDAGGQANNLPVGDTYEVGTFSFNVSQFGVYDMVGNVWEWVGEPYDSVPAGENILRGGRFGYIKDLAYRQPAKADDQRFVPYTGFRCAADQVEEN